MAEVCVYVREFEPPRPSIYPMSYECVTCGTRKNSHLIHTIEILDTTSDSPRPNLICTLRFNYPLCKPTILHEEISELFWRDADIAIDSNGKMIRIEKPIPKIIQRIKLIATVINFEFTPTSDDSDLLFLESQIPHLLTFFDLQCLDKITEQIQKLHQDYLAKRKSMKGRAGCEMPFVIEKPENFIREIKDEITTKLKVIKNSKLTNDVCQTFAQVIFRHVFGAKLEGMLSTTKDCPHVGKVGKVGKAKLNM